MISGKALAEQIGVALPTLSQAAAKGHLCRGHDVSAWAVRGPSGRVIGYELPVSVTATLTPPAPRAQSGDGRPGWTPSVVTPTLSTAPVRNPSPGGDGSADGTALWLPPLPTRPARKNPSSDGGSGPSMPPRVDYFRPVAAASTAHVVTKALESDTPSGRVVTTTVAVAGSALIGYHIAGKEGALLGAGLSLLIARLMYRPQAAPSSSQPVLRRLAPQAAVLAPARPPIRVGYASTPRSGALMLGSGSRVSDMRGTVLETQGDGAIAVIA